MKLRVVAKPSSRCDHLIVPAFEGEPPSGEGLPEEIAAAARRAARREGFEGRLEQTARTGAPGDLVVAVHGLGRRADLGAAELGAWTERALRAAVRDSSRAVCLVVPEHPAAAGSAAAFQIARRALLADYRFTRASERKRPKEAVVELLPPPGRAAVFRSARGPAEAVAAGVSWARDLANTPPNEAHPEWMAEQARELARLRGMRARILGPRQLEKQGMGGLLAVGGGSAREPRLVRLSWGEGKTKVALVGKGVTFDTGGISIKPSSAMDEMKFDKSGACVALGVAKAAAELDLPYSFRVYLPLAENMLSGTAYRPGDVVTCYNKKTVEILNTDAEGRMILADALAWAAEDRPDVLVDYATLTGACVVALGHHAAGLFTPDDGLADELLKASAASGERLWRLPVGPEYARDMKGRHADLRNSGSRWGGASTAAAFLSQFVEGAASWAHLDIAGTAYVSGEQNERFGSTGFGVALTLTWLLRRAGRLRGAA